MGDDFETVRAWLPDVEAGRPDDPFDALDRLVKRTEQFEQLRKARAEGEKCMDCGQPYYPVIWAAENDLWNEVIGSSAGMLCPECFAIRCVTHGLSPFFVAFREHVNIRTMCASVDREETE